ncbi:protein of unknown function [Pseudodesulfovibrio piezophilus C1TLV30]|uniref:Uncharacterized protein n=1 Tax=Pseudodesulfovibrio piezophilus (strain DSM 21447 / JCM 15486 / C1TLV30) TaxID=1322246 RepID=M1WVF0_PSEP2|nr:protein of unknown function [Pseudodesulfovibrio piezophilus C1TLV30]
MWFGRCIDFLERHGMPFDFLPENLRPAVLDTAPPSYSFKVNKREVFQEKQVK